MLAYQTGFDCKRWKFAAHGEYKRGRLLEVPFLHYAFAKSDARLVHTFLRWCRPKCCHLRQLHSYLIWLGQCRYRLITSLGANPNGYPQVNAIRTRNKNLDQKVPVRRDLNLSNTRRSGSDKKADFERKMLYRSKAQNREASPAKKQFNPGSEVESS
jgi:hypothetical protein